MHYTLTSFLSKQTQISNTCELYKLHTDSYKRFQLQKGCGFLELHFEVRYTQVTQREHARPVSCRKGISPQVTL